MTISKSLAATVSISLGVLLTIAKVIIGVATGSLSILAEAIDAMLDLLAAGVTYLVVRVADLPPDDNHPYGHARADNLGALAQALLLVATALWILSQAFERIVVQPETPEITIWSLLVIGISLLVNVFRVRILHQATAQAKSQALTASLANFSNDMVGSVVVLLALVLIGLNPWLGLPEWFIQRVDALAATCVALLGLYIAWGLGREAIRALMDDVPPDLNRRLVYRIAELPDVIPNSTNVRTRFVGEQPYVDVVVGTSRERSLEEAHKLADTVEQLIQAELQAASVLVHVEPARAPTEPYTTGVYSVAQRLGLRVHNLDLYQLMDGVRIEMDLEVPGSLTLAQAHRYSEELEAALLVEFPNSVSIAIHLEPRRDQVQPAVHYPPITERVQQTLATLPDACAIAGIETLLTELGVIVVLRCQFPATTPLTEVHDRMACIEHDVRRALPEVVRVQIDPEPMNEKA